MMRETDVSAPSSQAPVLLRRETKASQKMALKEKFVQVFEGFFRGDNPSLENANFWNELLLLKVNGAFLEQSIAQLGEDHLLAIKDNVNLIVSKCSASLGDDNHIRVANALQILCIMLRAIFRKNFNNFGFDVINLIAKFDEAEGHFQLLVSSVQAIFIGNFPASTKSLALRLLTIIATATENVNQNTLVEFLMMNSVFESTLKIFVNPALREQLAGDALILLTVLATYRKHEAPNAYAAAIGEIEDEVVLKAIGGIMSRMYEEGIRTYASGIGGEVRSSTGLFHSLSSLMGSMFTSGDDKDDPLSRCKPPPNVAAMLLALYEAVTLNRNFVTVLTYIEPAKTELHPRVLAPGAKPGGSDGPVAGAAVTEADKQPTNLLSKFLTLCSYLFHCVRDDPSANHARLCLVVITCIVEDNFANAFLHDPNMTQPSRGKRGANRASSPCEQPLAAALLDLLGGFVTANLKRNLRIDLYVRCIGAIHRMLCYEKRFRVRLAYTWKELWSALVGLVRFVLANEVALGESRNVYALCGQVVNIFNLFITFGDTFLPDPASYDELYYEVIRVSGVFRMLNEAAKKHVTSDGQWKDAARRLSANLTNLLAIIGHFTPKIDAWSAENQVASITPEQVLAVIRNNYDTLTLKLQEGLDQYERHAEQSAEGQFFRLMTRAVVAELRALPALPATSS